MAQDSALRHLAAVEQWCLPRPIQVLLESIGEAVYGLDRHGRDFATIYYEVSMRELQPG